MNPVFDVFGRRDGAKIDTELNLLFVGFPALGSRQKSRLIWGVCSGHFEEMPWR